MYANDTVGMLGNYTFEITTDREVVIFPSFNPQKNPIVNSEPIFS